MKKAKVALILTGHMRCWEQVWPNIKKHFVDPYDTDVFISTWQTEGYWTSPENDPENKGININSPEVDFDRVEKIIKPKDILIDPDNYRADMFLVGAKMLEPLCKEIRPYNVLSQFYRMIMGSAVYERNREEESQYDWIVRMRPDLIIHSTMPNFNAVPNDFIFTIHHPNHEGLGTGDMFFASSPRNFATFMEPFISGSFLNIVNEMGRFCPHMLTKKIIKEICKKNEAKHVELHIDKTIQHTPNGQYKDWK